MDKSTGPWTEFQSSSPSAESGPWDDFKAAPEKPRTRGLFEAVNDNVIEFANAAAGGVSALANFVKPGNAVSGFIDENIIKAGEQKQSDVVQGAKRQLSEGLQNAQGIGDEVGAVGRYVLDNPLLAASQAAGSFALPAGTVKGAGMAAKALGAGVKGVETAGRVGGVAAGAAMAGGDAAGTAYDLASKAGATEDQALAAGRQASVIPALVGGVTGAFGAERLLAGAKGFGGNALARGLKSGLSEAGQEAVEEGVTQFEGQRAAMPYDSTIDPTKGVAGAAAMGGIMGFGPGAVLGAMGDGAAKPSQQMGIDPGAGPLSRAAAASVDSAPPPQLGFSPLAGTPIIYPDGSVALNSEQEFQKRTGVGQGMDLSKIAHPSQPLAAEKKVGQPVASEQKDAALKESAPVAPISEAVPLEQRSLDELRQAFRSAQEPAIRKTLAAEIRKRREAMPDPLAATTNDEVGASGRSAPTSKVPHNVTGTLNGKPFRMLVMASSPEEAIDTASIQNQGLTNASAQTVLSVLAAKYPKKYGEAQRAAESGSLKDSATSEQVGAAPTERTPAPINEPANAPALVPSEAPSVPSSTEVALQTKAPAFESGIKPQSRYAGMTGEQITQATSDRFAQGEVAWSVNDKLDEVIRRGSNVTFTKDGKRVPGVFGGVGAGGAFVINNGQTTFVDPDDVQKDLSDGPKERPNSPHLVLPYVDAFMDEGPSKESAKKQILDAINKGKTPQEIGLTFAADDGEIVAVLNGQAVFYFGAEATKIAMATGAITNQLIKFAMTGKGRGQALMSTNNKPAKGVANARRAADVLRGTRNTSSGAGADIADAGVANDVGGPDGATGAAAPVVPQQGQPGAGERPAADQAALRPDGWRTTAIKAGKVARSLGLDPKGKRLKEIVAEIDAKDEWKEFAPSTGTLNVPRAEMPQIKAEHRGAMVNFLSARGVESEQDEVSPSSLKPTQSEFSLKKVEKAAKFGGTDRSILVSSDGHVVDGHHQWLAKMATGQPVKVIRLKAPIANLLPLVREFPSSTVDQETNVKNTQSSTAGTEAQASPVEARAPEGGNAAADTGVPAAPGAGDVQADGVDQSQPKPETSPEPSKDAGSVSQAKTEAPAEQVNPEPSKAAQPKAEKPAEDETALNDRDTFTLNRLNRETNEMEPVTFKRGEYVRYTISGKELFGEIDGISQAKREFSVEGLWYPMGYAYKTERPAKKEKPTEKLSKVIEKVNAKNGEGLTDADRVPDQKPASKTPTIDRSMAVMDAVRAGTGSLDDYKASFAAMESSEEAVKAELNAKTKDELLKAGGPYFYMRFKNETKPEIIRVFYNDLLNEYALGKSYGSNSWVMSSGGFAAHEKRQHEALKALVEAQTDEDLKAFAAEVAARREEVKAKREAKKAAIANPQTLEDFRAVMREHITVGKTRKEAFLMLTPEQRVRYDELEAETTKEARETRKRERKTEVRAADQTTGGEVISTKHTRSGYDLFVVQLSDRLSREDYNTVLASAKKLGGWYSSFRGNGAVPGFQFKEKSNAEAFLKLAGGDTTDAQAQAEQRRDAFEDDRSQTAVERLRTMADKLEEQASDIEGADRKTNTARRARFASRALAGAAEMKAKAKTMRNVAQSIEDGKAKFLDGIRTKTQVDMLSGMVATAKNNELRAKYESYAEQEKRNGEPPTAETADFAEFPAFTAYRSDLASLARQMLEVEGTKKLGQQLMKIADDVSDAYLEFAKEPGNLLKLSTFSIRRGDEVKTAIFPSKDLAERAIKRSGLTGKAIVLAEKRGVNRIIMSPSEAINAGIWTGDGDKRITLTADAGNTLVEAIGRRGNKRNGLAVPWQFQTAHDRLKALARMGIETPAEFRSALREFIGVQERAMSNKVREMELAMVGKKNDGLDFFPTPAEVADQMVEASDLTPEMDVLEPSGGMGHIADRIRETGAEPDVVEMAEDRRELLAEKGYELVGRDFLDLSGKLYDRIIMNPPFSNRRDAEHVRHAYSLLKPGGRIVAIMGEGVFFGSDKKAQDFRDWLDSVGGTDEKLPAGSFMDPSLPVNTGVNARMVVIDKPAGDAATQDDGDAFMGDKAKAQRQGTHVDRAIMEMAGEGREANEILSFIVRSSKSPYRRQLAQKLLATGANPAVSLGGEMGGGAGFRFLAKYSRKNHEVTLSEAAGDRAEQIFLHETVHAATLLALDKGGLFATQMNRLYESAKKQGGADGQYGLKNVGEFVAEAFTNPDFQKALKGMKADTGSLWDRFVAMVRRVLGLPDRQQDMLSAALDLGAKVMRENMPLRAAKSFRAEYGPAFAGSMNDMPEDQAPGPQGDAQQGANKGNAVAKSVVYKDDLPPEPEGSLRLFHGGSGDSASGQDFEVVPSGGNFDGFFASANERKSWGAHGSGHDYFMDIPIEKVLSNYQLNYEIPYDQTLAAFEKFTGISEGDPGFDAAWTAVIEDKSEAVLDELLDAFGMNDFGEAGWLAQKYRGQVARELGFSAVEMSDEHGTSYLVVPGVRVIRAYSRNDQSAPDTGGVIDDAFFGISDAVEQIKQFDVKSAPKQTLAHYRGMALQALGRRQLVDLYSEELPQLETYNDLVQQMDAEKNDTGAEADRVAQDWGSLKGGMDRKLAELMHDATLAKMDPDKPMPAGYFKRDYDALKARFDALSPEAKTLYRKARDMYVDHYKAVQQAIKDRVERSEMSEGQKRKMMADLDDKLFKELKGVYFPLARFGQYVIVVKDANGEVVNVTRAETVKEAEQARKELQKAFPASSGNTVGKVLKQAEFNAGRDAVGKGFMADLMGALDEKGVDDELRDTVAQLYLSSLPDLSWAKHGIHRKGTPGFSQDARRAFAQNMFHGARYLAKLRHADRLQDLLIEMQDHIKAYEGVEEYDSVQAQQVVDEMVKRHEWLMNPKASPVSTALTSFGFLFHMGLSPASAMVNLTQTALVAYPQMGAKWGFARAGAALTKASEETVRAKNDLSQVLKGDELDAFNRAVKDGTIDVTMAHDLAGIAQGEDQGVMWKIRPVMRWASFMFHHAEKFNRQATFLAAYRLAKAANPAATQSQLYEQAKQATYDGHFDYSSSNRARIMQGNWQRVIFLFKQYAQSMVYTLARNAYLSVKALDPKERSQARKTLGGILAAHAVAAGVLGLPIVGPLLTVASWIGGDDDEPWDAEVAMQNAMAEMIGPKAAEVVARGFSRLTPFDLSGRVALNKLILPDVQEGLEGKEWAESAMAAALGPVAGIGVNMARGAQKITEGDYMRGLEDMMPTALRGPLKAMRYANEGAVDKTGVTITEDVSAAGVLGQASGFSPSQVRRDTERRSAIYSYDRALLERRSVLMRMFAQAQMSGDTETAQEVRQDIQRFNEKNPTRRITPMNIAQSIRNRRKRVEQAEQGVYLPSKRRDALEAVTF